MLIKAVHFAQKHRRKALKGLLFLCVIGMFLFFGSIVVLKYFFPSDAAKEQIQSVLSETLNGEVSIISLSVDPFARIEVKGIAIRSDSIGAISVDRILLKYNIFGLLQKKIEIQEIILSGSSIELSLPQKGEEKREPETDAEVSESEPFALPFSINLNSVKIVHTDVIIPLSTDDSITLTDLNLDLSGKLSGKTGEVKAAISIEQIMASVGGKKIALPFNFDASIFVDLENEKVELKSCTFNAPKLFTFNVTGELKNFLSDSEIKATLFDTELNLGNLYVAAADFLPNDSALLKVTGVLKPQLSIKGVLPDSIEVESFSIGSSKLVSKLREETSVTVQDFLLSGSGKLRKGSAALTATLETGLLALNLKEKSLALPLKLHLDTGVDFEKERLTLRRFSVESEKLIRLVLYGIVNKYSSHQEIDMVLSESTLTLDHLIPLLADFLPPEAGRGTLSGAITPEFSIVGTMSDTFSGKGKIKIVAENLKAELPESGVSVKQSSMTLVLPELKIVKNLPEKASVSLNLESKGIQYRDYHSDNLKTDFKGEYQSSGLLQADLLVEVDSVTLPVPDVGKISSPVSVSASINGNLDLEEITLENLKVYVDNFFELTASGALDTIGKTDRERVVTAQLKLKPKTGNIVALVPEKYSDLGKLKSDSKSDLITLDISTVLGGDNMPRSADIVTSLQFQKVGFKLSDPSLTSDLDNAQITLRSKYDGKQNRVEGRVAVDLLLKKIAYDEKVYIDSTDIGLASDYSASFSMETSELSNAVANLTLNTSSFGIKKFSLPAQVELLKSTVTVAATSNDLKGLSSGTVEGQFSFAALEGAGGKVDSGEVLFNAKNIDQGYGRTESTLSAKMETVSYAREGLSAFFDSIHLSVQTAQAQDTGDYSLKSMEFNIDNLMQANGAGSFNTETSVHSLNADLHILDLEKLSQAFSGEQIKLLEEIKPKGSLAFSIRSEGKVPEEEAIKNLSIPLSVHTNMDLSKFQGVFSGNVVEGLNVKTELSFTPEGGDVISLKNVVSINEITLPEKKPMDSIQNVYSELDLTVTGFDNLKIEECSAGLDAAGFFMQGEISGFRNAIIAPEKPLGELLKNLYVNLQTGVSVDTGRFQELLAQNGIRSQGRAGVTFDLLKRGDGRVTAEAEFQTDGVSIEKDGAEIKNLNLAIPLKKQLHLSSGEREQVGKQTLHPQPSSMLSELRAHSLQGKNFGFQKVDLGFVEIENFSGFMEFDGKSLNMVNLKMDILDGVMGGDLTVRTGEVFGLTTSLELVGTNMNKLLPEKMRIDGDAVVAGLLDLSLYFKSEGDRLNFEEMEFSLKITKIGKETLDRLLLFLDPEESKPAIVNARSKLKLANPSTVTMHLSKGVMDFEIVFQQGLLSSLKMERIPINTLKNLKEMEKMKDQLKDLAGVMKIIATDQYMIDANGTLIVPE